MEENLTGLWTGTLIYGKEYRQVAGQELRFDIEFVQVGNEIAGIANDTGGAGTSPDEANIMGVFNNNEIDFIKQYESSHSYSENGELKIDRSKKGPPIKYSGKYNEETKTFSGEWLINMRVYLFWIFPMSIKNSGTWTMRRK